LGLAATTLGSNYPEWGKDLEMGNKDLRDGPAIPDHPQLCLCRADKHHGTCPDIVVDDHEIYCSKCRSDCRLHRPLREIGEERLSRRR
jgi:hypothetical protein